MILDILLVLIIIGCVIRGYFKGVLSEILDIIGFVLGAILFRILYPLLNIWFLKSSFYTKIREWVSIDLKISELFENSIDLTNSEHLEMLNIPNFLKEKILELNNSGTFSFLKADTATDYVTAFIANIVVGLVLIFFIIILISILLSIIARVFKIIKRIKILDKLDKVLGVGFGVVNGIFTVWLFGIIVIILVLFPQFTWLKNMYENSKIAMNIFEGNVLIDFLVSLITSALK